MADETHDDRFRAALEASDPGFALHELALALKDEGVDQMDLFVLFARFQQEVDGSDPRYDAVVDNMDLIMGGPWANGCDLFETVMTNDDIAEARIASVVSNHLLGILGE